MPKGNPIPVKFEPEQEAALQRIHAETGMPVVEIIRKAFRLFLREYQARGGCGWLNELAPGFRYTEEEIRALRTAEKPAEKTKKGKRAA